MLVNPGSAHNRGTHALILGMALVMTPLAAWSHEPVSVCRLASMPHRLSGKTVTVQAEVLYTAIEYPSFLKDSACPDKSLVVFATPQGEKEGSVANFIRELNKYPPGTNFKRVTGKFGGIVRYSKFNGRRHPSLELTFVHDLQVAPRE